MLNNPFEIDLPDMFVTHEDIEYSNCELFISGRYYPGNCGDYHNAPESMQIDEASATAWIPELSQEIEVDWCSYEIEILEAISNKA